MDGEFRGAQLHAGDLINSNAKSWNFPLICSLFDTTTITKILHTPLFALVTNNRRIWSIEINKYYSTKSAYRLSFHDASDDSH